MATGTPTKGSTQKTKEFTEEDIAALCKNIEETLMVPDKSSECCTLLKQLLVNLQTHANGSSFYPEIPPSLIRGMMQVMSDSPSMKGCSGSNKYLLCQMIIIDMLWKVPAADLEKLAASKAGGNFNMTSLYLIHGQRSKCLDKIIPHAKRWVQSQDLDSQKTGVTFLTSDVLVKQKLLDQDTAAVVSERLAHWLSNSSVMQAPNPRTLNPFRKDEETPVTELDGTPSTNLFTVLNIGQYFTDDQLINIHGFSCLYQWLCNVAKTFRKSEKPEKSEPEGAAAAAAQEVDEEEHREEKINVDKATVEKVLGSLVSKSVDYCFRLIDQCERKAKVPADAELQVSTLAEAVRILDIICSLDEDQTARVFQEVKRLNTRISQESRFATVLIYVVTFFFHHSAAVVHDPRDTYHHFFTTMISANLNNQGFVFPVIDFVTKNLHEIGERTDILSDFFPNFFKILAWHPRLFMKQFTSILPMAMNLETSVEIFHLLLDLPCMTAALEVMEKAKKVESTSQSADSEPTNPVEAFHNVRYKPLFLYITRSKGGQGDTIDRLSRLHAVLRECMSSTRVMVCCQLVPLMLRIWFISVLDSEDPSFLAQLIPVIIERSGLLVAVPELITDVHKIFADQLVALIKAYPSMVTIQQTDIREFIQTTANLAGRVHIYCNMIYVVGEFASPVHCAECTSETIGHFYESLEVVAYELLGQLGSQEHDPSIAKVISTIVSALAKLASRCQDLIPRAILCLTKVVKQQNLILLNPTTKDFIVQRASSLIALLKNPDTAYAILNPDPEIYTAKWHQDSSSMSTILRCMERMLQKNH